MKPPNAPQPSSIRIALNLPFSTAEVAEYVFRSDVLAYWLGKDTKLSLDLGSEAVLPTATPGKDSKRSTHRGSSTPGKVTSVAWPAAATGSEGGEMANGKLFELVVTLGATAPTTRRVTFRLAPRQEGQTSRLRIECSGLRDKDEKRACVRLWQSALNRIDWLITQAHKSRRRERQAVIVVHGVGEQRPGQFLRQFVDNIFDPGAGEVHFVKPDYVSPLFEMRMATVPRNEGTRPTTDVYELYWAHLIRDTTVAQVYGWIFRLLTSRGHKIPRTLTRVVWGLRVLIVAVLVVSAWLMTKDGGVPGLLTSLGLGSLAALPALASAALKLFQGQYIVGYAGDAARYLEPRPDNIARRQEIREAGTQLLDALHKKGRYSRVIVYGHSLGSVIAYDILSHAWAHTSRRRSPEPAKTSSRALRALEDLLNPRTETNAAVGAEVAQPMQYAAWHEYRQNGFQWLVSDFVTAGSPLTHARWLLNLDAKTQFAELVEDRSFPTCPPQTETIKSPARGFFRRVFTFTHAYENEQNPQAKRSVQVPNHAGLFALTRWTNLYFPYSGLIKGDPIGGPLVKQFGDWVRDVPLLTAKGFAHSRYTNRDLDPKAASEVRKALNLPLQRPLAELAPKDLR